jgi:hypothetical protein
MCQTYNACTCLFCENPIQNGEYLGLDYERFADGYAHVGCIDEYNNAVQDPALTALADFNAWVKEQEAQDTAGEWE